MIKTAMSRRTVLAGAAAAGMALPGVRTLGAPGIVGSGSDGWADIIVIGAGLAGLSAARHLKERGASVIVLEARDRAGGRVYSRRLASGQAIDFGAQFIGTAQKHVGPPTRSSRQDLSRRKWADPCEAQRLELGGV